MTSSKNTQSTKRISYTGILLDDKSVNDLKKRMKVPSGWRELMHHCTLRMGGLHYGRELIGTKVEMLVQSLGVSEEAMAVRVLLPKRVYDAGDFSTRTPHITVAIPEGSKPFYSNRIEQWDPIDPFKLTGIVTEVEG